jgi:excinuclease ABC subunit A
VGQSAKGFASHKLKIKFQFKGLYPALEEASRISPSLRQRLEAFVGEVDCHTCGGSRLRDDAAAARLRDLTIDDISRLPLGQLQTTVDDWKLTARERKFAGEVIREIQNRVQFLNDVGLEYLSLARGAATLSNGEAQRIRLASQLGSGLCGVLYVLDEPTIGLHPRDNTRLLKALHKLRDLGNTLIVVEHDREVIENCDHVLDFGPQAGRGGGQIVGDATPAKLPKVKGSVTGPYLSGKKAIVVPTNRRGAEATSELKGKRRTDVSNFKSEIANLKSWPHLALLGARHNNLRNVDLRIPLGTLTAITGPSGSGKSSLIEDVLYAALAKILHRASETPGAYDHLHGLEHINKVIRVDQQPLGNSPTSNPATYTGVFELVRTLFAQLPEAKLRGYNGRRFSFNVPGGRCEKCEGNGQLRIEMHFLPDVWVECDECRGRRYNAETLAVTYHGHSISDVLDMTCGDAVQLFQNIPKIRRILQTLCDVGLDYLTLGQPAPTLSGGEAQRVKLAAELSRPDTGRTLYLLDEPTTGLHFDDLAKLLDVLHRLVDLGNTVVVIEHNLDVIKSCDWIVDLGPEAGQDGGRIVAQGTPETIAAHAAAASKPSSGLLRSHTGEALAPILAAGPQGKRVTAPAAVAVEKRDGDLDIEDVGRDAQMPWQTNGRRWHTQDRVDRKGQPAKWDGRILERVVDFIHEHGDFADTNWDARSVVEITGHKKTDGWFMHAITGETYLLKLKFRCSKGTFRRDELAEKIKLKTLNELDNLPIYSNEPRIKVKTIRGPWQEVEIRVHTLEEIDTPEFWSFLKAAIGGFNKFSEKAAENPSDLMPWKKLGQKWHFLRKGFPPGKTPQWDMHVLEELFELLTETGGEEGQFLWNNQQLVHLYLRGQRDPWATVLTKRLGSVDLALTSPKGTIGFGRVRELGFERELDGKRTDRDVVILRFRTSEDLARGDLAAFLREHKDSVAAAVR